MIILALIECKNITLAYEKNIVLESLSFQVDAGDYLCIIGENGSGKTTLMKAILGLKAPLKGEIILGDGLRRNEIGYLPQQTGIQKDFPASVFEVVLSGCLNRSGLIPFYTKEQKQQAMDNMAKLNITSLKNACYRELSGGQQQRVLIARALCATGKLLLLDEPVTGLDPDASAELYELIDHLNKAHGITIIMITHDTAAALPRCSHILHLHKEMNFFGRMEDYGNCSVCAAENDPEQKLARFGGKEHVHHECCDHHKHF
jgi:zinc transport system ATP-binding protein